MWALWTLPPARTGGLATATSGEDEPDGGTSAGTVVFLPVPDTPSPSWPEASLPQVHTEPSAVTPTVKSKPAEMY